MMEKGTENTVAIAELHKDIQYIKESVDNGFDRVTSRQDIANGKLIKHETEIAKQKLQLDDLFSTKLDKIELQNHENEMINRELTLKDKIIYCILGIGVSMIIFIVQKLIENKM